jgi:integrase
MRIKLTDRYAAAAPVGLHWDTEAKGLVLQITKGGSRAYRFNYRRQADGVERRLTIGDTSAWPIAEARKRVAEMRRIVDTGGDPLGEAEERRAEPTVSQLIERYNAEVLPLRSPRTQAQYVSLLRYRVEPVLGGKKVGAVTRADIERLHRDITREGHPRHANATKTMVFGLYRQAITWGLCEANPAAGIKGSTEKRRVRWLSEDELQALLTTLDDWQDKKHDVCDTIRLALLTGARRSELLAATWDQIDWKAKTWLKPTTKNDDPHLLPLAPVVIELLQRRYNARQDDRIVRLRGDEYALFRGVAGDRKRALLFERGWQLIRRHAGLRNCHFHDLRHHHATMAISQGATLALVGGLLGHRRAASTARYAHVQIDPLRAVAEAVAASIVGGGRGSAAK